MSCTPLLLVDKFSLGKYWPSLTSFSTCTHVKPKHAPVVSSLCCLKFCWWSNNCYIWNLFVNSCTEKFYLCMSVHLCRITLIFKISFCMFTNGFKCFIHRYIALCINNVKRLHHTLNFSFIDSRCMNDYVHATNFQT